MGLPETESALAFFLESYPQALSTGRARVWIPVQAGKRTPPIEEIAPVYVYTPQQNIFPKVRSII